MMHEIPNFRGGVVTNIAYHPGARTQTAQLSLNNRVNDHGWLISRKGRVRISDLDDIDSVFSHRNYVFVVADNGLYWAVTSNELESITFQRFGNVSIELSEERRFMTWSVHDDVIFVRGGDTTVVIKIPEGDDDSPSVPETNPFYLRKPTTDDITLAYGEDGDDDTPVEYLPVEIVLQPVFVDVGATPQEDLPDIQGDTEDLFPYFAPKTVIGEHSEPIQVETARVIESVAGSEGDIRYVDPTNLDIHDVTAAPNPFEDYIEIRFTVDAAFDLTLEVLDGGGTGGTVVATIVDNEHFDEGEKRIEWHGADSAGARLPTGSYFLRFRNNGNSFYYRVIRGVEILDAFGQPSDVPGPPFEPTLLHLTLDAVPDGANYIDIYSTTGDRERGYYHIARMPAVAGAVLKYQFPVIDIEFRDRVLTFESPDWDYIAVNEFRSYAVEARSHRIYISFYDPGTGERLYQNYTDFIDLELGEGYITGLHFLRNNRLIVFATNQIQILATDPLLSLHSVLDFIKPRDDNGLAIGCAAPRSIVDMGGVLYFLGMNRYVYAFNGQQIRQMSDPVQSIFDKVLQPRTEDNTLDLQSAVGFAHGQNYVISLSIPSSASGVDLNFPALTLVADQVYEYDLRDYISAVGSTYTDFSLGTAPDWITLDGYTLQVRPPSGLQETEFEFLLIVEGFLPNTTMVLDRVHNVWWQDDFGVVAASKDTYGRIFGVINGRLYMLYEGETDDGDAILRTYKANPYYTRAQDRWESVHVYTQEEAVIDVFMSTEQVIDEGQIVITELNDWFSNRLGCNLRGRVHTIEIKTESPAAIDRITTNERLRNR